MAFAAVSKYAQSDDNPIKRLEKCVTDSYQYFSDNIKRFQEFRKYNFETTITNNQRSVLNAVQRPEIEFNILSSYISRLLGEFSQHEPSINLFPAEGEPLPWQLINLLEGHIRHILEESKRNSTQYNVVKDVLSGGFGCFKVYTEYSHPMSMRQVIRLKKPFDACLVYFDPLARTPTKDDGYYCGEIYPKLLEECKKEWPDIDFSSTNTNQALGGFSWTYKSSNNEKYILIAEHYEKVKKRVRIVELADGQVITESEYNKILANWDSIEQMPIILRKRTTTVETIKRVLFTKDIIIEEEDTDFDYLPYVFVDGASVFLNDVSGVGSDSYQFTTPYTYHGRGIQNLKNCAGQSWANAIENQVQHKFIIKEEAIPEQEDLLNALTNIQQQSNIVVRAFNDNNPEQPIPDPIREVMPVPMPPEIANAFQVADVTAQVILGGYQSNPGEANNYLSGEAMVQSMSISNAGAMPYIASYLAALAHVGTIILSLIPKYLIDERHLPIVETSGEMGYQKVNSRDQESMSLKFDPKALKVDVKAGINFQIQKQQALREINAFCAANEGAQRFFNSPQGLPIVFKNLTIYGADEIQDALKQWIQAEEQNKQQMMKMHQQEMQNDPNHLKAQAALQKNQIDDKKIEYEHAIDIAELNLEQEKNQADIIKILSEANNAHTESAIRQEELQVSKTNHAIDAVAKLAGINKDHHEIIVNAHQTRHDMKMDEHAAMMVEKQLEHDMKQANKEPKADASKTAS